MEILNSLLLSSLFYKFKIDLIVWKLRINNEQILECSMFKIDLIVWK